MNNSKIITFGCRLNLYESDCIKGILSSNNLDNVVVFNSCAVTEEAERQLRQAIRKVKRNKPEIKIIVTGCAVENDPIKYSDMKEVYKVIGNSQKLLSKYYLFDKDEKVDNNIIDLHSTESQVIDALGNRSRAFLQVQNGCDHRCTFCIIPYTRGGSRSVPLGVIVNKIKKLVEHGYNEVVFTGVDITAYGQDLPGYPTFANMIERVLILVPELKRLRLSSIDVAEIDDKLFYLMAYNPRLMPHFHISLQSGDNMILKRMKRRHNREAVINFCQKLRSLRSNVSFGADIIAGFPTETDEMFENTRLLITQADLQYLHIFPYSIRSGTPASKMPQVPKEVVKKRAQILRSEGKKQLHKFYNKNIGAFVTMLVEANNIAHTENFISVKLENNHPIGSLISSELIGIQDNYMISKNI